MEYTPVYPLQITKTLSLNDAFILILDAPERGRHIPVLIGDAEAQALIMAVEQRKASRPLTHNLLNTIMEEYLLSLRRVTIDRFEEGVFYATLTISDGFSEKLIDSRTSDALVLAALQQCPVSMSLAVLEETSMAPGALEDNLPKHEMPRVTPADEIEALENKLRQCEKDEDYEQAAVLQQQIEQLKNDRHH